MKYAFIFPGQGSQYPGMGKDIVEAYPQARQALLEADEVLEFPLSRLCLEGPKERLALTENTQPAVLAISVAILRVVQGFGFVPFRVAGHSLGEYSALVAAEGMEFADALRVVRQRGQFMQEAVPVGCGAMAAVLGLNLSQVEAVCCQAAEDQVVSPANINAPAQIVIAGHAEAVNRASRLARKQGAHRVISLPVSAPFHCALMKPAQSRLAQVLERVRLRDLKVPLVNNAAAQEVTGAEEVRRGLIEQVSSAVRWTDSVQRLCDAGVETFVEIGPGRVLSGLIRKIAPQAEVRNIGDVQELKAYV